MHASSRSQGFESSNSMCASLSDTSPFLNGPLHPPIFTSRLWRMRAAVGVPSTRYMIRAFDGSSRKRASNASSPATRATRIPYQQRAHQPSRLAASRHTARVRIYWAEAEEWKMSIFLDDTFQIDIATIPSIATRNMARSPMGQFWAARCIRMSVSLHLNRAIPWTDSTRSLVLRFSNLPGSSYNCRSGARDATTPTSVF